MNLDKLKLLFAFLAFSAFSFNTYAQGLTEFEIKMAEKRTEGAKYGKFRFVDLRRNAMYMGFVQTGAFNRKSLVIEKDRIELQLIKLFDVLGDKSKDKEMLVQLRYCAFSEQSSSFSEFGYFALRANLYGKQSDSYQLILGIDTVIKVSAMDVTNRLMKTASETFVNLIDSGLRSDPKGKTYSFNDVVKIDSVEKSDLAAYKTPQLSDGTYSTSLSFLLQQPDAPLTDAKVDKSKLIAYAIIDGKKKKVKPSECYAVVYKGEVFISYLREFYHLEKQDGDFVFNATIPIGTDPYTGTFVSSTNYGMMGGMSGGAIGGAIGGALDGAMNPRSRGVPVKLDHITGKLMIVY